MTLTEREMRLFREDSDAGRLFRAGAAAEARARNEGGFALHRELINYVRALIEYHPDLSDAAIAQNVCRVFSTDYVGRHRADHGAHE